MIDLFTFIELFVKMAQQERPLTDEERKQFQAEQQCSIGFAGLKAIWRQFV